MNVDRLKLMVGAEIRSAEIVMNKFAAEVAENHYSVLAWSGNKFQAAAILDVFVPFREAIEGENAADAVYDGLYLRLLERVADSAKSIENSTSPQSVYMDRCVLAARAKLAEIVGLCGVE